MECFVEEKSLVSIIIPVYNVVNYFAECMKSVLEQTYNCLEIILVDDGSSDGSEKMCDLYAEQDKRVKVIHQKNSGQAAARNRGIDIAKGQYIAFVDSDDVIEKNYIKKLYDVLIKTNADVSMCYYDKFYNDLKRKNKRSKEIGTYTAQQAIEQLCYQRYFNNGPVVKLWKKEMIGDIRFPINVGYEDFATIYKYMANAEKIALLDETLYYYRQHKGSTMRKKFCMKNLDRMYISEDIYEFVKKQYPDIENSAIARRFLSNLQVVMNLPLKKEYLTYWEDIKKNIKFCRKIVMFDRKAKISIRVMAASSYLGVPFLKVLGIFYNIFVNRNFM